MNINVNHILRTWRLPAGVVADGVPLSLMRECKKLHDQKSISTGNFMAVVAGFFEVESFFFLLPRESSLMFRMYDWRLTYRDFKKVIEQNISNMRAVLKARPIRTSTFNQALVYSVRRVLKTLFRGVLKEFRQPGLDSVCHLFNEHNKRKAVKS